MQERHFQRTTVSSFLLSLIPIYLIFFATLGLFTADPAWAAAPAAPTSLTATMVSSRQINLAWQDKATTESNYYVERSPNGSSSWTVIATLGANVVSYQSTSLTQNTTYYYRVRCKAGTTYSSYSNKANARTATLAAPTGLTTTVVSAGSISLGWTDTAYETQYSIERSPNGTSSWVVLGTVASNVTSTTNSGLTAGTAYYYRVRAYDSTNYSAYSTTVNQTIRTIAASAGANGAIAPSGTVGVANGTTKVFAMTPSSGYKIATVTVDGSAAATNPTYTFTNVTANHTIAATFSVNTVSYTVTASAGFNGSISPSGAYSVSSGGTATFTITPNANYHVADVVVDGVSKGSITSFTFTTVTANHTIAASFDINTFTITPSVTGSGSITPSTQQIVSYGSGTIFSLTPNAGYYLSGLQVDGSAVATTNTYTFTNVTTNHTIAATFSVSTYTISASAGANGSISPSGAVSVNSGATTAFSMTPNTGYYLSNLSVDGSSIATTNTYTFTNVTANHTIAATFSVNTYTITASSGPDGTISPNGTYIVSSGGTATFTITPAANYHVADVVVDGILKGIISSFTFTNVIANHTITASFETNTFTVTPSVTGGNGSINPSTQQIVSYGSNTTFTMTPNAGYHVSDVLVDTVSVGTPTAYTFNNVTADHTINVSFADTYTITSSAGNHGMISPSGIVSVNTGATATFIMTPDTGYHVSNVLVDMESAGATTVYTFNNVSADHTISGLFSVNSTTTIITGGVISTSATWTLAGSPYIVTGNVSVYGTGSPTLTIEPGVVVKFNQNTGLSIGYNNGSTSIPGALNAVGALAAPIVFTSNQATPTSGYWSGITFNDATVDASSVLDYVTVEYGGGNGNGNLYLSSSSPKIQHSTIRNSSSYGIYASSSSSVIQDCAISENSNHGIYSFGPLTVMDNTISNNGLYGLNDSGSSALISGNTFSGNGSYPVRMSINRTGSANTYGTNGTNAIEVLGGTVSQNITMKNNGIPYIITSAVGIYSWSSPVLTIEPGVTMKFNQNIGLSVGYNYGSTSIPGALNAVGALAAPIVFTSNQATPTSGYWSGITFNDATVDASSVLDYVTVEYGGGNLYLSSSSPMIKHSTIRKSSSYGIYASSSSSVIQDCAISENSNHGIYSFGPLTVIGNTISNNGTYGLNDSGSAALISGNTFSGNGSYPVRMSINRTGSANTYATNGTNAIEVLGGTVSQNLTMKNNGIPYIITSAVGVYSWSSPVLTIEPGVTMKFNQNIGLSVGYNNGSTSIPGALNAIGTPSAPIVFTSNQATPTSGFWSGITFNDATVDANTVLDHVTVEYGGQGGVYSSANLVINSSSPVIMNSTIRNSAGSGVYMTSASNSPVIVNSDITGNKWGVYSSSSNPYVRYSSIYANTTAGVWNSTTSPDVDARENWWGVATGPTYTAGNPGGRGDSINDHVLYNPWLGQPKGGNLSITEVRAIPGVLNPTGGYIVFSAQLSSSATWTITISDGNNDPVNTFTGSGTVIKQKWYGTNSQFIKVADGPYYYRIDAQDQATGDLASSSEGLFMVSSQVPIVYMDSPVDNQVFMVGATINITGRVSDTDFKNYTLEYGVGVNPVSWTLLQTATTQVTDGLIYAWNTSALTGSLYTLRLTVNDYAGNTVVATVRVQFIWAVVSQVYISPNGDGIQDTTTFSATLNSPSEWTITLKDASGAMVKSYNGNGTTLSQVWDGTNAAGTIVADSIYTYQIAAGTQSALVGSITVDTTPPTALITTPTSSAVIWSPVPITGSASDMNSDAYKVEYSPTSNGTWTTINLGSSSVTNNLLSTWITNDPALPIPNGNYIIRLTVKDKAGNTSIASVPVILNDLQLTNVSISAASINTLAAESTSIYFTVNAPATATLKVIPEILGPTGAPLYQTSRNCSVAGAYSFTWNGQDNTGKTVPDEAYIYILEASDGVKTYTYNPPAPTGTGTVTCSRSGFDPVRNVPMTVTFTPAQPSRVNIIINWSVLRYTMLSAFPVTPTTHTYDWDGRNPINELLDTDAYSSCSVSSLLPVNYIITTGDTVKVTDLKTDPYAQQISYGQFTRITYTLSRDANVTVKLTSPTGSIFTLVNNQFQTAGSQALDPWNGLDATDITGKKTIVDEEGDYMVSVQAVNPSTGTSSSATRANLRLGF